MCLQTAMEFLFFKRQGLSISSLSKQKGVPVLPCSTKHFAAPKNGFWREPFQNTSALCMQACSATESFHSLTGARSVHTSFSHPYGVSRPIECGEDHGLVTAPTVPVSSARPPFSKTQRWIIQCTALALVIFKNLQLPVLTRYGLR